ncbi:MAG: GNAT family N-acetyltransferase [Planctomycetota bacterium]|nr:GNAT family N-acetyltransferase [Planctomycetota bacterium]
MSLQDPVAETERLRIRHLQPSDIAHMRVVYGDLEAMRYVGDGSAISEEDCVRWVDVTLKNYTKRGYGMFVVELKESGRVIGFCGLVHPGDQELPELKYAYLREHWGQGYASEAGEALRAHGEHSLGMPGIIATVDPEHIVSHRVLAKCNFTLRKTITEDDGLPIAVWAWGQI